MAFRDLSHPWDNWFAELKPKSKKAKQEDYPTILLRKGEDYHCLSHSMVMQWRRQATLRGLKVRCQMRDDGESVEIMLAKQA